MQTLRLSNRARYLPSFRWTAIGLISAMIIFIFLGNWAGSSTARGQGDHCGGFCRHGWPPCGQRLRDGNVFDYRCRVAPRITS